MVEPQRPTNRDYETSLGKRIQPQPNGCWLYRGKADKYGQTKFGQAHRVVYELLVGPIPEGHHLHHECRNPGCVNPKHLRPLLPKAHVNAHSELLTGDDDPAEKLLKVLKRAG